MADLLALRTQLRRRVGNPTTADVPDADLTGAINSAYSDIAVRYKFHNVRKTGTIPTVVGTLEYNLPADVFAVLRVRDNTNKKNLTKVGDRAFATRSSDTNVKPEVYLRRGNQIIVMSATGGPPDAVYTLEVFYKSKPADLSGDTDTPVIPVAWHEGIIRLGKYYHYDVAGDLAKAASALQLYNIWVETMPLEFDDEAEAIDSGVEIPTLHNAEGARLDFDHSE